MKLLNPGSASSSAALVLLVSLILTPLVPFGPLLAVRADSTGSIFRGVDDVINKEEDILAGAASMIATAGSGDVRALKAAVINLEEEVLELPGVDDVINIGFETQEKESLAGAASMIAAAGSAGYSSMTSFFKPACLKLIIGAPSGLEAFTGTNPSARHTATCPAP